MMSGIDVFSSGFGMGAVSFSVLALIVWSLVWKGLGLWHAAKRKQSWWFIAMLIVNTAGILEIVYLFAVAKVKTNELFK
jgi:uncharacterized membrane protein